jgi:3',5'-nucleoside bisphosphate phosphatase
VIDLHIHTTASDGASSPARLVEEALAADLGAIAVCDHDTLAGSEMAAPIAREAGLDFISGIELSARFRENGRPQGPSIHLLGYFPHRPPAAAFRDWVVDLQAQRHQRNARMIERLRALGCDVTIDDVSALSGGLPGRPHFARVLLTKGYVPDYESAFREYLGESGRAYVARQSPDVGDAIRRIEEAGGVASLAHPVRLKKYGARFGDFLGRMKDLGLGAIEIYHSEHTDEDVERFRALARDHGLLATGGSDYHGDLKPNVHLGMGSTGHLSIPGEILDALRDSARC